MDLPTYADVLSAAPTVYEHLLPTLLYDWPMLGRRFGFRLFLKHENHQPTGAFKVRGGVNLVSRLSDKEKQRGIIGCTTGNHGQSLAFAAARFGVRCVLVVPLANNPGKNASMRALGADLIEHGADYDDARKHCEELTRRHDYRYIHSANEPSLVAGVGTMGLEIFDQITPDVILAPIGLGRGICGNALVAAARHPKTRVIGVQATGASAVADSWRSGRIVQHDSLQTFAEGLATRAPAEMTLDIMRRLVSDIVLVDDDQIREAMRGILEATHNLPEPAGAATTAAAWKLRDQLAGKTVVAVLSGGNCDLKLLPPLMAVDGAGSGAFFGSQS